MDGLRQFSSLDAGSMNMPWQSCLISILRGVEGMLDLIPSARVGHVGLYRDPDTLVAAMGGPPIAVNSDGTVF